MTLGFSHIFDSIDFVNDYVQFSSPSHTQTHHTLTLIID